MREVANFTFDIDITGMNWYNEFHESIAQGIYPGLYTDCKHGATSQPRIRPGRYRIRIEYEETPVHPLEDLLCDNADKSNTRYKILTDAEEKEILNALYEKAKKGESVRLP